METKTEKLTEKKENDKVIKDSKKTLSDEQMIQRLNKLNVEQLTEKTAKTRSLWKLTDVSKDDEKSERRKLRRTQLNLSKSFLRALKEKNNIPGAKQNLQNFSNKNLIDISNYTNVSKKENPEVREILDLAYKFLLS